jgi:hypothetical protein
MKRKFIMLAVSSFLVAANSGAGAWTCQKRKRQVGAPEGPLSASSLIKKHAPAAV